MVRIPPKYTAGLSKEAAEHQTQLIQSARRKYEEKGIVEARPKVSSTPVPRSSHAAKFENKYGYKISELSKVKRDFPDTDVEKILTKGRAAYASSGSRPNTTPEAWAKARLASVLTGGKALSVDKDLVGPISRKKIRG
jgi:hypothetical protein